MFTNVDVRGVSRGQCTTEGCECDGFTRPSSLEARSIQAAPLQCGWCCYCGHSPVSHSRIVAKESVNNTFQPEISSVNWGCTDQMPFPDLPMLDLAGREGRMESQPTQLVDTLQVADCHPSKYEPEESLEPEPCLEREATPQPQAAFLRQESPMRHTPPLPESTSRPNSTSVGVSELGSEPPKKRSCTEQEFSTCTCGLWKKVEQLEREKQGLMRQLADSRNVAETTPRTVVKIWSMDHQVKKAACANSVTEIKEQARQKDICTAENAKVFLKDGTEVDEGLFERLLNELPLQKRIFVVGEASPLTEPDVQDRCAVGDVDCPAKTQYSDNSSLSVLDMECLPQSVRECLEDDTLPLPGRERRELVRVIVEKLTRRTARPKRKFIRTVAEDLVKKFPGSLKDVGINGEVLGRGYDSLLRQMENRVENLRRGRSGSIAHAPLHSCKYQCQNCQPLLKAATGKGQAEKLAFLKMEGQKAFSDIDVPLAMARMDETYALQREFINSHDPSHMASQVKEQWPLLLHRPFFYRHCENLLGKDVQATFRSNVSRYAPLLLKSLEEASSRDIMYLLAEAQYAGKKNEAACEAVLMPLLAAYFKDRPSALYHVLEEGTSISSKVPELPLTPVVVAIGSIHHNQCYAFCEQQVLVASPTDFSEATCLMFLAHFMFNIDYADTAATTLEFLQREIFELIPGQGCEWRAGQRSRRSVHSKVLKLSRKLGSTVHAK